MLFCQFSTTDLLNKKSRFLFFKSCVVLYQSILPWHHHRSKPTCCLKLSKVQIVSWLLSNSELIRTYWAAVRHWTLPACNCMWLLAKLIFIYVKSVLVKQIHLAEMHIQWQQGPLPWVSAERQQPTVDLLHFLWGQTRPNWTSSFFRFVKSSWWDKILFKPHPSNVLLPLYLELQSGFLLVLTFLLCRAGHCSLQ